MMEVFIPVQPANFLLDEFVAASNGRYYHAIMQGKNLMGAYKDKIDYEERWQVIHYIRALQAKEKKLAYSQMENTFNPAFGSPAGETVVIEEEIHDAHSHDHDAGHHGSHDSHDNHDDHSHGHDNQEGHDEGHGEHSHDHHEGH